MTITQQEAKVLEVLQYDLEIPYIVQWRMLLFSAPTSFSNDLLTVGKYETINLEFQSILRLPYFGMKTARTCFLKAMRKDLGDMPERMWNLERPPDLLPDSGDDEMDNEMGPVDH